MTASPLVSTDWLAAHLSDPSLRILEISAQDEPKTYDAGHVPGAQWVNWKAACWHETDRELVRPAEMARLFGAMGIGPATTLVLYGDPVQYGTYAFWAFTMAGHAKLLLLDGGRRKWVEEGRPLSTGRPRPAPVDYPVPDGTAAMRIGRRAVRDGLGNGRRLLLDVRSPEEYSGERVIDYSNAFDHGAQRGGRIPGAKHLYFKELIGPDDAFKSPGEIAALLAAKGFSPGNYDDVVCYCRLSHRATLAWFALAHLLGHDNVKVYDGSWTEWGSIVGFPIER